MVYLYKKTIGQKDYYYLRASVTKNGKQLTKDIAYLGSDPSLIQEKLHALPRIHQQAIRKAYKTLHRFVEINRYEDIIISQKLKGDSILSAELFHSIEACAWHWKHTFERLDTNSQEELLHDFIIAFSFNTTSLEGNTITFPEAENLLRHQRTPKDRTLREVYDIQNTKRAFLKYHAQLPTLTHTLIQELHDELLEGVDVRKGYRTQDIRVTKSRFTSSPARYVYTDMDVLLQWYHDHKDALHPFVLATLFHHFFERIHPFFDGNGRTGRMLMTLILLAAGYPPIIIQKKHRSRYLDALSKADNADLYSISTDHQALLGFCANEYVQNYWSIFL